jgi:uncharacterized membrane protein
MLVLFLMAFGISWSYETTSIPTGFPCGHYHYTDKLGPKLALVPLLIIPAYFAVLLHLVERGNQAAAFFSGSTRRQSRL